MTDMTERAFYQDLDSDTAAGIAIGISTAGKPTPGGVRPAG